MLIPGQSSFAWIGDIGLRLELKVVTIYGIIAERTYPRALRTGEVLNAVKLATHIAIMSSERRDDEGDLCQILPRPTKGRVDMFIQG